MNFKRLYSLLFVLIIFSLLKSTYAQDTTQVIGDKVLKQRINYYDFSDPLKINFEVIVWGGFKYPGKYLVPEGTTVIDLLTYSGLPSNSDLLEEVKLLRTREIASKFESSVVLKFNYQKFFDRKTTNFSSDNPLLKPGDILLIPIEQEKTFWDYFKESLVIIGPIASILSLYVTINNNK